MSCRAAPLAAALALGAACAAQAAAPFARDGWARPTAPGSTLAAGYLVLTNPGPAADRLLGVSSPAAARVELHESRLESGIARMRPVPVLELAAGATVRLAPGALHLMLVDLQRPLERGAELRLALRFEHAGTIAARLAVGDGPAATPQRVVTLSPHLTEFVFAAGAGERLIGTIDTSDYPPAARRVPRIGDVTHLDAERLLALHPDLVLLWGDGSPAEQRALLQRLRLPVLSLEQHALADVPATLEQLGRLFGTEPVANAAAAALRDELAGLRRRYGGERRLRVFYEVWGTPLYTLGARHVANEMLDVCGAVNIFADQSSSSFVVDAEAVYARDPDAIALAGTASERHEWLASWHSRAPLRALSAGAVVMLDPDLVNRMGPRIGAGTRQLCERLDAARRAPLRR